MIGNKHLKYLCIWHNEEQRSWHREKKKPTHWSVSTCLSIMSWLRLHASPSQITIQSSPESPSPSSPNAEISCLSESGEENWWEWRFLRVGRCSSRMVWPHTMGSLEWRDEGWDAVIHYIGNGSEIKMNIIGLNSLFINMCLTSFGSWGTEKEHIMSLRSEEMQSRGLFG